MDPNEKDRTVRRYLRGASRHLSHDELKARKELQKRRKAERAPRKARRDTEPDEIEEDELFERIRRRNGPGRGPAARAAGPAPVSLGPPPDDAPLVVGTTRGRARVEVDAEPLEARLAPALAATQSESIVVGDRVRLDRVEPPRIEAVYERRTVLARPDPSDPRRRLVLAANVDVGVVVLALREPPLKPALVDRFLVALERGGVDAILCVHKLDLARSGDRERVEELFEPYRAIGVDALTTSTETGEGLDRLRELLRGRTAVFVGHSGVGKSSLQNVLHPDGARRIGDVRASDGKGRHTTTSSSLVRLPDGTQLIDTPGVREFGLWDLDAAALLACFPELESFAVRCRFRDCSHRVEPGCAVREAVEAGLVPRRRFEAYERLLDSLQGDGSGR